MNSKYFPRYEVCMHPLSTAIPSHERFPLQSACQNAFTLSFNPTMHAFRLVVNMGLSDAFYKASSNPHAWLVGLKFSPKPKRIDNASEFFKSHINKALRKSHLIVFSEMKQRMTQNRTLIAYETKGGATEESARKIADVLRSKYQLEVDLVDLKKQNISDCSQYHNIVIGGGVRGGKVYHKALKCLENDFSGKKVAFFVSSGDAGDPEKYQQAKIKYVENVLANYPNVKPVATEAFGGRMKILGRTVWDNTDLARVEAWAEELGNKFSSSRDQKATS